MARTSTKAAGQPAEAMGPIDDDIYEDGEFLLNDENDTIKRDARRKIEIYWEKKRLRDEFDDLDENELGF